MAKKGPLYVAMFKPLGIVFAVIMGITFLGDSIYLGRYQFISCALTIKEIGGVSTYDFNKCNFLFA